VENPEFLHPKARRGNHIGVESGFDRAAAATYNRSTANPQLGVRVPLYEYQCTKCEYRFERIQKFSDPPVSDCPKCGGAVSQLLSAPAIQFKGSGWYVTDYAKKSGSPSSSSGNGHNGSGKSDAPAAKPETPATKPKESAT
jgi:putative FmdB family regulatory protein